MISEPAYSWHFQKLSIPAVKEVEVLFFVSQEESQLSKIAFDFDTAMLILNEATPQTPVFTVTLGKIKVNCILFISEKFLNIALIPFD